MHSYTSLLSILIRKTPIETFKRMTAKSPFKLNVLMFQLNANNSVKLTNIRSKINNILESNKFNFKSASTNKLIVFPELAYHRYLFDSNKDVEQFLQSNTEENNMIDYFKSLSKKYNSYVISGFIERDASVKDKFYNSSICVYKDDIIKIHRKKHLYYTDEKWTTETTQDFSTFKMDLTNDKEVKQINCSMGICMDVNPYKFIAPFDKYEFSSFCAKEDVDLVVCPTAWTTSCSVLQNETEIEPKKRYLGLLEKMKPSLQNPNLVDDREILHVNSLMNDKTYTTTEFLYRPDIQTINYWYSRFKPMHDSKNKYLLFCDKAGIEDNSVLYNGSSTCIELNEGNPMVKGCLTTGDESVLSCELEFD